MTTSSDRPRRTLRELAEHLGVEAPSRDVQLDGLATVEDAGPTHLTFLANDRYIPKLRESRAGAALVPVGMDLDLPMPVLAA